MPAFEPLLIRSFGPSGEPVVRLGVQLLDDYLDFVAARCRPNTVLATAYDLLVFFRVVNKAPGPGTPLAGPGTRTCTPKALRRGLITPGRKPHPWAC